MPYATFGNSIDLDHYERLSKRHKRAGGGRRGPPRSARWNQAGRGVRHGFRPVGRVSRCIQPRPSRRWRGGLIYCADPAVIARLRAMSNFGFDQPRIASLPGLNAKLSESVGLDGVGQARRHSTRVIEWREAVAARYHANLNEFTFQQLSGRRTAHTFMPLLLPQDRAGRRAEIVRALAERGDRRGKPISARTWPSIPISRRTASKATSPSPRTSPGASSCCPLSDTIAMDEVDAVCHALMAVSG